MKKLLSLLMCFVFLQAETFALRGGPGGQSAKPILGAYTGIMLDISGSTDLGMFILTAIKNGASTGQVAFFQENSTIFDYYVGDLTGVSDTAKGIFYGVFDGKGAASSTFTTKSLSGQVRIQADAASSASTGQSRIGGTGYSRTNEVITVPGMPAIIMVTIGPLHTYAIDGWQSSTSDAPARFTASGG